MNKKVIFSIILCIVFILSLSFRSLANKIDTQEKISSTDLFGDLIKTVSGKTVEYGITAQFDSNDNRKKTVNKLFDELNNNNTLKKESFNNNENYSIEFHGKSIDGYIESTQYKNHNVVKLDIVKQDKRCLVKQLKSNMDNLLKNYSSKIRYYEYIKVKTENNNTDGVYRKVTTFLKDIGDNNINTEAIENGYTSTTYTGQYEKIYSNGVPIDFNFAVITYSTGTYLIMGTPQILESY